MAAEHADAGEEVGEDAERAHWDEVAAAFRGYTACMLPSLGAARLAHDLYLARCGPGQDILPPGVIEAHVQAMRHAIAVNQVVLNEIADGWDGGGGDGDSDDSASASEEEEEASSVAGREECVQVGGGEAGAVSSRRARDAAGVAASPAPPAAAARPARVRASHFSKVKSTLHQLARDWSSEGADERAAAYGPLLRQLEAHCPLPPPGTPPPRVCVPGCGAARLLYEVVARGYAAQGNEFSVFMLLAAARVLNAARAAGEVVIHPWIHDPCNHLTRADMMRAVALPDVLPAALPPGTDMSMVAGDFVDVYAAREQRAAWSAVLTAFFLDTAPCFADYVRTIAHMLAPGGVWINLGPLLYHWHAPPVGEEEEGGAPAARRDERYLASVELPWEEVRAAIARAGFEFLHEEVCAGMTYAANARSLQQTVFRPILFTARKTLASV